MKRAHFHTYGRKESWDLDALKAVSLVQVAASLGLKVKIGNMQCPLPDHNDQTPSFSYRPQLNTWKCFGCGKGGTVLDFVMCVNKCDLHHAAAFIQETFFGSAANRKPALRPKQKISREPKIDQSDPDIYNFIKKYILLTPEIISYFERRCISQNTLRKFGIGQLNDPQKLLQELRSAFEYKKIARSGVLSKKSTVQNARLVFADKSIIFPFLYRGTCEYLQARSLDRTNKGMRWMNLNEVNVRAYNRDLLLDNTVNEIYICEGATDALSAAELGWHAIALPGAGNRLSDDDLSALQKRDVYIIPDKDKAGKIFSNNLSMQLKKAGITSFTVQALPPQCKDLNDYLVYKNGQHKGQNEQH